MALPRYLALTAAEFQNCSPVPSHPAWMACHFSPNNDGLSNQPDRLPPDAILIVNDRFPLQLHTPARIIQQLETLIDQFSCHAVLLDFQRPGNCETARLVRAITDALSCAVGVSEFYAGGLSSPVFLAPVPLHMQPFQHFSRWEGRELWLDLAPECTRYHVAQTGCTLFPENQILGDGFYEPTLFCHYRCTIQADAADFHLWRTPEDLDALENHATRLGVTHTISLWQEWNGTLLGR